MPLARSASAIQPRHFGRGPRKDAQPPRRADFNLNDDFKLFATTFAAGFIFVSVLLA